MFSTNELNEQGTFKVNEIAKKFTELLSLIELTVPDGRERAIIRTKLQEAAMFVRLGVSMLPAYKKEGE